MKTHNTQLSTSPTSANEMPNNSDSSNGNTQPKTPLITYDTETLSPLVIVTTEQGHFAVIGEHKLTPVFDHIEHLKEYCNPANREFLLTLITSIALIVHDHRERWPNSPDLKIQN